MKVKFITLGCKVNQYESEAMLESLVNGGFQAAGQEEAADVVVINSCTVTATGDQKARQALRRAKKENPGSIAVLTGCMPQAFPREAAELKEADIILGTGNRSSLLPHILSYLSSKQRIIDIAPHQNGEAFEKLKVSGFQGHTRAFLKIQDGCNRFCSYCIIPYARGRVRSKPLADIEAEVKELAAHGFREIVLTGINLPAYGQDLNLHLCDAVEATCAQKGVERVRLGSLEPEQLSDEVIARLARQKKLCSQFHLSLQSGCDETLRRMNRHYTTGEYRRIVASLRKTFENCAITTDVMVGFAGETQEEFEESLAFVKEISFSKTHVFPYSRRPGTRAYDAPGQCSNKVKTQRSKAMAEACIKCQQEFSAAQIGRTEEVLFEREREDGQYEGYTRNYTPVIVHSPAPLTGKLVNVRLESLEGERCIGTVVKTSD